MPKTLVLAIFLVATSSLFAQSLTEKIDVSLVNVDVSVTSHGAPARGLTRDDFQVFEDGVARPITNFYAVEPAATTASHVTSSPTPDATATLADPTDERFRRKVLVIIDNRHVTMHNRDRALAALERFVDDRFTGGTYDWSIALVSDKVHLMLPLTSDKEKLHEAVGMVRRIVAHPDRPTDEDVTRLVSLSGGFDASNDSSVTSIKPGAAIGESLRSLVDAGNNFQIQADATRTVEAIRDAVRSFAGAPGRKIILLVTGSLGLDESISPLDANPGSFVIGPAEAAASARFATVMRDILIREANASNVSFFIINSEGLAPDSDASDGSNGLGFGSSIGRSMGTGNTNPLSSMYWLARETGGRLMSGNSPVASLADFDRTSSSFYSLAYKPAHGDDGKYHTIKVRMNHSGYQLQYRTGYSSIPATVQLARAMDSPLGASMQQSSIPINIITGSSAPQDGGVLVPLQATVAAKNLQFIPTANGSVARVDLYVSVFDDRGRKVTGTHYTREAHATNGTESDGNFVETRQLLIKKGIPYRVVVGVHDQVTDAIGIASQTVRF
jgi:VWFA-related protein